MSLTNGWVVAIITYEFMSKLVCSTRLLSPWTYFQEVSDQSRHPQHISWTGLKAIYTKIALILVHRANQAACSANSSSSSTANLESPG